MSFFEIIIAVWAVAWFILAGLGAIYFCYHSGKQARKEEDYGRKSD